MGVEKVPWKVTVLNRKRSLGGEGREWDVTVRAVSRTPSGMFLVTASFSLRRQASPQLSRAPKEKADAMEA